MTGDWRFEGAAAVRLIVARSTAAAVARSFIVKKWKRELRMIGFDDLVFALGRREMLGG